VHSKDILLGAEVFKTVEEAVADCSYVIGTCGKALSSHTVREILVPEAIPTKLREVGGDEGIDKYAILFGNESLGLGVDDLKLCNVCVTIPTKDFSSFNLSQAVAITLYTVYRCGMEGCVTRTEKPESEKKKNRKSKKKSKGDGSQLATFRDIEMLQLTWEQLMKDSEFRRIDVRDFLRNTPMSVATCHQLRLMFGHLSKCAGFDADER